MDQVYIFDFGDKIKVGFSTNVQKRLRTIELSSGVKAKKVYSEPASRKEEQLLHRWLDNRLEGEFFAFPFDKAKEILCKILQGDITTPPSGVSTTRKGHLQYKINILQALKENGYNTTRLRREKLLGESTIQQLRQGTLVSWSNIERLCVLLNCQPGDIIEYTAD